MTDEQADRLMIENIRCMGYQEPDALMQKRIEAALGSMVPLWRSALSARKELMQMQMHRSLIEADRVQAAESP